VKVHFAATRGQETLPMLLKAGVNYHLDSYYYIRQRKQPDVEGWNRFAGFILDSGLFTLMFGADAQVNLDTAFCENWQNDYLTFINGTAFNERTVFVEMDVQKKISPEYAWDLRRRFNAGLNKGTPMNVYHLEDGNPDKLIEFSPYIGCSQPEMRKFLSRKDRESLTNYIVRKSLARGKRCHLLGLTEHDYLKKFAHATSCDSTSWMTAFRYGDFKSRHFGSIRVESFKNTKTLDAPHAKGERSPGRGAAQVYWAAYFALMDYKKTAGDQS
jgi:hypothetical protein